MDAGGVYEVPVANNVVPEASYHLIRVPEAVRVGMTPPKVIDWSGLVVGGVGMVYEIGVLAVPVQPFASVPVTKYVVPAVGVAVTDVPLPRLLLHE